MRIVSTTSFGWIDMDHVLRVTPLESDPGEPWVYSFRVYVMMLDTPFVWRSDRKLEDFDTYMKRFPKAEYADYDKYLVEQANEHLHNFLLAWRDKK